MDSSHRTPPRYCRLTTVGIAPMRSILIVRWRSGGWRTRSAKPCCSLHCSPFRRLPVPLQPCPSPPCKGSGFHSAAQCSSQSTPSPQVFDVVDTNFRGPGDARGNSTASCRGTPLLRRSKDAWSTPSTCRGTPQPQPPQALLRRSKDAWSTPGTCWGTPQPQPPQPQAWPLAPEPRHVPSSLLQKRAQRAALCAARWTPRTCWMLT